MLHFLHHGPYRHIFGVLNRRGIRTWAPAADFLFETPSPGLLEHKDRAHLLCLLAGGCQPFPASGSFSLIGNLLARRQIVAIASDVPGNLPARLLGRNILVRSGTARIALAASSPIVCVTWHSRGPRTLPRMSLHGPIDPRKHADPVTLQAEILARHESALLKWPEALASPKMRQKLTEEDGASKALARS